jgi:sec-independent protein translocase protein TatB
MFSIGFAELLVIAVITLLVVGPERLPETIRFISLNVAKFRRYWQSTRRDIEKDLGLDELRREIHNAAVMEHLEETKKKLNKPLETLTATEVAEASSKESALVEEVLAEPSALSNSGNEASADKKPLANKEPSANKGPSAKESQPDSLSADSDNTIEAK